VGVQPLADRWAQRGKMVHRYYVEDFLRRHRGDIRGHVLEFQEDSYATRFGEDRVTRLDILDREPRLRTTLVADLTTDNAVPSDSFDCIICTYVLHLIFEKDRAIAELHRILKPGGTLLVAVPGITVHFPQFAELWRFTEIGLRASLAKHFGEAGVAVEGCGNSLVAAGELRGLALADFTRPELEHRDPRFAVVVCARAVKGPAASSNTVAS
jgi:SAM-dependent methyltransferase